VVLEAPAQYGHTRNVKGGSNGVAGKSVNPLAIKLKFHPIVAVNQFRWLLGHALDIVISSHSR